MMLHRLRSRQLRRAALLAWLMLALLAVVGLHGSARAEYGSQLRGPWRPDDAEFARKVPTLSVTRMPRTVRDASMRDASSVRVVTAGTLVPVTPTPTPTPASRPSQLYTPSERFGVAFSPSHGRLESYPLHQIPFAWYADWSAREQPQLGERYQFAQTIRVSPEHYPPHWDGLQRTILANPGSLWIIGNEPECMHQDARTPEQYAEIYHTLYSYIKTHDPTAQVAVGGVVQPTPLRLQWLDRMLAHYRATYGRPMPVDVWNIHVQILRESRGEYGAEIPVGIAVDAGRQYPWWENDSIAHFRELVWGFRRWMAERGYRDRELIISEFGVLMPVTHFDLLDGPGAGEARVKAFMTASFDFLLTARDPNIGLPADGGRLVQRWLWFSLNHPSWEQIPGGMSGFNGGLVDPFTRELTPYGLHYAAYMRALASGGH